MSRRKTWRRERKSIQTELSLQKNRKQQRCVCCSLPRFSWWIIYKLIFLTAKDLRIEWRSFKISVDGDVRNLPTRQTEWKMQTITCLRNWNQNTVIIGTVTGLHKIYWSPDVSHRWFCNNSETYNAWAFCHSFWKVIFKRDCIFCNTEWRKKIKWKCVRTTPIAVVSSRATVGCTA